MLYIVLITTLVGLLAASITGIVCINWIRSSSEKALTSQLENNLKSIVTQKAVSADAKLEHYEKYIQLSADYIEKMYADKENMISRGRNFDAPHDTNEFALTRVLASEKIKAKDLEDEILLFSNIEEIWDPMAHENDGLITTIYAGTKSGLLTSYDKWSYLSAVPEGKELYYDYFKSGWYTEGIKKDDVFYTGLYIDSMGRGLTITVAEPFKDETGKVAGVCCADYDITGLYNEMLSFDLGQGTTSFTLDSDGNLISPDAESTTVKEYTGLTHEEIKELIHDSDGIMVKGDSVYVSKRIDRVGWTLCACVSTKVIRDSIIEANKQLRNATIVFIVIAVIIIILAIIAAGRAAYTITHPMELLSNDMAAIAGGNLKHRAKVYQNDEIGDMTKNLNDLVDRLTHTMDELLSAKQQAEAMSRLAVHDSLTGIRNKTAYEALAIDIDQKLAAGPCPFGIVMIDMNNLKEVNDKYGHSQGDFALKKLSKTICDVFAHSPVFRIGGDEFAVILMNSDYGNIEKLIEQFLSIMNELAEDTSLEPWEIVDAAIGYAIYDENIDTNVQSVMERADKEMYKCKRTMALHRK